MGKPKLKGALNTYSRKNKKEKTQPTTVINNFNITLVYNQIISFSKDSSEDEFDRVIRGPIFDNPQQTSSSFFQSHGKFFRKLQDTKSFYHSDATIDPSSSSSVHLFKDLKDSTDLYSSLESPSEKKKVKVVKRKHKTKNIVINKRTKKLKVKYNKFTESGTTTSAASSTPTHPHVKKTQNLFETVSPISPLGCLPCFNKNSQDTLNSTSIGEFHINIGQQALDMTGLLAGFGNLNVNTPVRKSKTSFKYEFHKEASPLCIMDVENQRISMERKTRSKPKPDRRNASSPEDCDREPHLSFGNASRHEGDLVENLDVSKPCCSSLSKENEKLCSPSKTSSAEEPLPSRLASDPNDTCSDQANEAILDHPKETVATSFIETEITDANPKFSLVPGKQWRRSFLRQKKSAVPESKRCTIGPALLAQLVKERAQTNLPNFSLNITSKQKTEIKEAEDKDDPDVSRSFLQNVSSLLERLSLRRKKSPVKIKFFTNTSSMSVITEDSTCHDESSCYYKTAVKPELPIINESHSASENEHQNVGTEYPSRCSRPSTVEQSELELRDRSVEDLFEESTAGVITDRNRESISIEIRKLSIQGDKTEYPARHSQPYAVEQPESVLVDQSVEKNLFQPPTEGLIDQNHESICHIDELGQTNTLETTPILHNDKDVSILNIDENILKSITKRKKDRPGAVVPEFSFFQTRASGDSEHSSYCHLLPDEDQTRHCAASPMISGGGSGEGGRLSPEEDQCEDCAVSHIIDDEKELSFMFQHMEEDELNEVGKLAVLSRCSPQNPIAFVEAFPPKLLDKCKKIGEGVYGEVFMLHRSRGVKSVLKIIPVEGSLIVNGSPQKRLYEVLSELIISEELSLLRENSKFRTNGFCELKNKFCLQGEYPDKLLELWDKFDAESRSENERPDMFTSEQLYLALELEHAGTPVESYAFSTAKQAYSVYLQTLFSLAVAEIGLEFEHRDLHVGNVLVQKTRKNYVSFVLNGSEFKIPTYGVKATIIDFTLSRMRYKDSVLYFDLAKDEELFTTVGTEYQFEIYRLMKKDVGNIWILHKPQTNIRWLHYLVDKFLKKAIYSAISKVEHEKHLEKLSALERMILEFYSCFEFAEYLAEIYPNTVEIIQKVT